MSASSPLKSPWNPSQISWICILFGALPAVWLWVVNNRRLGLAPPLVTRVLVGASVAIYALVLARLLWSPFGSPLDARFRALNLVMLVIVAWQLFVSQRGAFARHRKAGGQTASVWAPLLTGIVGAGIMVSLAFGMDWVRTEGDYRDFERATELMTQNPPKMREAETIFKNFEKTQPDEPMTHWNLAVIYSGDGRIEQAQTELRALLKLEPENKEAHEFLRELKSDAIE